WTGDTPFMGKNRRRFFRYRASFSTANSVVFAACAGASLRFGSVLDRLRRVENGVQRDELQRSFVGGVNASRGLGHAICLAFLRLPQLLARRWAVTQRETRDVAAG